MRAWSGSKKSGMARHAQGAGLVTLDGALGGQRGFVRGRRFYGLPAGEGCGDEGLCHPREELDGLVAG